LYRHNGYDLWQDNFSVTTLSKIMRQKDLEFSQMLNRFRTLKSSDQIQKTDMEVLIHRTTFELPRDLPTKTSYVFAKNKDVDALNAQMLELLNTPIKTIRAEDFVITGKKNV